MHCNNFDSKLCLQIPLRNCRLTWWVTYKKYGNFSRLLSISIKIYYHTANYLMIKHYRNGITSQLRHRDCIGRHRYTIIVTHLILMFTNTLSCIKFILPWLKWVYLLFLPNIPCIAYILNTTQSKETFSS